MDAFDFTVSSLWMTYIEPKKYWNVFSYILQWFILEMQLSFIHYRSNSKKFPVKIPIIIIFLSSSLLFFVTVKSVVSDFILKLGLG